MNNMLPFLFMLWLVVWGINAASAACPKLLDEAPRIDHGASLEKNEMLELQREVNDFIAKGEKTLRCTGNSMRYNMMRFKLERVAENYNKKLLQFNSRLAALQEK